MAVRQRYHRDILAAGLIVLGTIGLVGGVFANALELPGWMEHAVEVVAAVLGAYFARAALDDLDLGEAALAAAVVIAIVVGIEAERRGRDVEFAPIIASGLGAALGYGVAWWRRPRWRWSIAVAGLGAFGAAFLAVGIALLAGGKTAVGGGVLIGLLGGGAAIHLLVPHLLIWHAAVGQGLVLGTLLAAVSIEDPVGPGTYLGRVIGGVIAGLLLGALAGWIGSTLRKLLPRRRPDVPTARAVD